MKVATLIWIAQNIQDAEQTCKPPSYHPSSSSHRSPVFVFEMGFCYVAKTGLKLTILLPQPPKQLGLQVCSTTPSSRFQLRGH